MEIWLLYLLSFWYIQQSSSQISEILQKDDSHIIRDTFNQSLSKKGGFKKAQKPFHSIKENINARNYQEISLVLLLNEGMAKRPESGLGR